MPDRHDEDKPKKRRSLPWLSKEERKIMEIIRSDLRRQAERAISMGDNEKAKTLETQINTLSRELAFDKQV